MPYVSLFRMLEADIPSRIKVRDICLMHWFNDARNLVSMPGSGQRSYHPKDAQRLRAIRNEE